MKKPQIKRSNNHKKALNKIAREHQRIGRIRQQFYYEVAHWLCKTYNLVALEDLNIKGLARTHLAKSIYDAAWGSFAQILEAALAAFPLCDGGKLCSERLNPATGLSKCHPTERLRTVQHVARKFRHTCL